MRNIFIGVLKELINNMSTLIVVAYFISRLKIFKNLVTEKKNTLTDKLIMSLIFGCIGIFATYTGVSVNGAIANSRIVGVMVGGIFGGPLVGIGAGLIAGIHRWAIDINGFTAVACAISTILEGAIGGFSSKYIKELKHSWIHSFIIGIFAEALQMAIILLVAKPFEEALELVNIIWIPMVLLNPVGISVFVALIEGIYREQEKEAAFETQKALNIAEQCLQHLRKGLHDTGSMKKVCKIILKMTSLAAVAITDRKNTIAHSGIGEEYYSSDSITITPMIEEVLQTREIRIAQNKEELEGIDAISGLGSVIIVPLVINNHAIGTLKTYKKRENGITDVEERLAIGLGKLFSTQLEIADADLQVKLREKAELKALQSQINPHFLFNALHTIVSFCRTKPEKARELLINLSTYFRNTLVQGDDFVSLKTELKHVNAYLLLENARFEDKLKVEINIEEGLNCALPQLILQPLVENAIKHGLLKLKEGGKVIITAYSTKAEVIISVDDTGKGIDEKIIEKLKNNTLPKSKVGLNNVNSRLISIYGENYGLRIMRRAEGGTRVDIRIPKEKAFDFTQIQ